MLLFGREFSSIRWTEAVTETYGDRYTEKQRDTEQGRRLIVRVYACV